MRPKPSIARAAFTLIEVTIALAIVATGIIAIVGMIPVGLKASRQAAEHTLTAIILEDVHDRLEGHVLRIGPLIETSDGRPGSPFYYDKQGVYISPEDDTEEDLFRRNYRADIEIVTIETGALPTDSQGFDALVAVANRDLKAVIIELSWPVNPNNGEPMGDDNPKSTVSYYLTSLTGPEWTTIDPNYEPKIEY